MDVNRGSLGLRTPWPHLASPRFLSSAPHPPFPPLPGPHTPASQDTELEVSGETPNCSTDPVPSGAAGAARGQHQSTSMLTSGAGGGRGAAAAAAAGPSNLRRPGGGAQREAPARDGISSRPSAGANRASASMLSGELWVSVAHALCSFQACRMIASGRPACRMHACMLVFPQHQRLLARFLCRRAQRRAGRWGRWQCRPWRDRTLWRRCRAHRHQSQRAVEPAACAQPVRVLALWQPDSAN